VPLIFERYAADLVNRLRAWPVSRAAAMVTGQLIG
jgi:hypothetical protein